MSNRMRAFYTVLMVATWHNIATLGVMTPKQLNPSCSKSIRVSLNLYYIFKGRPNLMKQPRLQPLKFSAGIPAGEGI